MAKADQVKKGFPFLNPVTPVSKMGTSHLYLRIFFSIPQASLYSVRQEHRKRCPCLFG